MVAKNVVRLLLLSMGLVALIISTPAVAKTDSTLDVASIDAYIKDHMDEYQIPGLALSIVHDDEIVYAQGYGVAGPEGTAITPQTPFVIGSTSKSFTALAIMQLVEAGQVELDATVQTYLPWFTMADAEAAKRITVRHLLTHSSGLSGPVSDKDIINPDVSEAALETHIRELADFNLLLTVGERYHYNNTNYDILGLIVQTVSGESFEAYVEGHIFSPLEMANSYTSKAEAEANGLAARHTYFFGKPRVLADAAYSRRKLPSGYLISSAGDLGHYLIAQLNEGRYAGRQAEVQILSPEYAALMHQPAVETNDEGISYAFGWRTNLVEGEPAIWHGGDSTSSHSNMAFAPTRGWGVAILINVAGLPQNAALNEPVNELFRISSGYEAGQIMPDFASTFYVLWGIAILSAVLNLLLGWAFRRRINKGGRFRLVRSLLVPLAINLGLLWFMFFAFPNSMDSSYQNMPAFLPETWLIFLVSAGIILLMMLFRLGVAIRSTAAARYL
jgi:CubicO group peptidase (beta-lactamase class C family)